MPPAMECTVCHERFETPQKEQATPLEIADIMNKAAAHASIETMRLADSHFGVMSSDTGFLYEPVTGQTGFGRDFHLKEPIEVKK